ncbi:GHMP family kinase ATP-binding protein [Glycomyces xiaoerkulensis]|uniref:GHMP family kinase ATP-binding protein n=1 Tax=Glycomyces xiaoerkulensis TaxID=2038139 RepID=UPI000C25840C|nr:hypothetical protein [Glycomyces xiaoerkulensis]
MTLLAAETTTTPRTTWNAPDRAEPAAPVGHGICGGHHGEILQGAFRVAGEEVRALITLPMPDKTAEATVRILPEPGKISVPAGKTKAAAAARLTLGHLGLDSGCEISLRNDIPASLGMGSSTADVVATIRAVGDSVGQRLPGAVVARLAVEAETAADSIMYPGSVPLFAHREGRILETLGPELPPLLVLGFKLDVAGIDTLEMRPARYTREEKARLGVLLAAARHAIGTGDPVLLGKVASASAAVNQRFIERPLLPELTRLARRAGAVGVQIAHSGSVAGVLFDAREPLRAAGAASRCRDELSRLGIDQAYLFSPYENYRQGGRQ